MNSKIAKFCVGEMVNHKKFAYRGVVFDVDAIFSGTDAWYATMARTKPPKDEPWYHVLVHQTHQTTYVAERNLEVDLTGVPINHPYLDHFFGEIKDGLYIKNDVLH